MGLGKQRFTNHRTQAIDLLRCQSLAHQPLPIAIGKPAAKGEDHGQTIDAQKMKCRPLRPEFDQGPVLIERETNIGLADALYGREFAGQRRIAPVPGHRSGAQSPHSWKQPASGGAVGAT